MLLSFCGCECHETRKGPFIIDVSSEWGELIRIKGKLSEFGIDKREGVTNPENLADVIFEWPHENIQWNDS